MLHFLIFESFQTTQYPSNEKQANEEDSEVNPNCFPFVPGFFETYEFVYHTNENDHAIGYIIRILHLLINPFQYNFTRKEYMKQ